MHFRPLLFLTMSLVLVQGLAAQVKQKTKLTQPISVEESDIQAAKLEGAEVFRILDRINNPSPAEISGGGAYYSFTNKNHSYDKVPQIELQRSKLSVGFYGANYGLMIDLQKTPLTSVSLESPAISFLKTYEPSAFENDARETRKKLWTGIENGGGNYFFSLPAVAGHTYVLRAVSFKEADTLVAFKVHRANSDGSLVIFWKKLREFPIPYLKLNN